jgi:enterochelin esterase family protein
VYNDIDGTLKKQLANGYKLYWIGMGKTDFLYQSGVDYRKKLDGMGFKYTYRETDGGHIWKNWRIYISEFASLLFQ